MRGSQCLEDLGEVYKFLRNVEHQAEICHVYLTNEHSNWGLDIPLDYSAVISGIEQVTEFLYQIERIMSSIG